MTDKPKQASKPEAASKPKSGEAVRKPERRIVLPERTKPKITTCEVIPATDLLLHDARCIVASELSKYRSKVSRGNTLDLKEARVVQGYLETLIRLQKEEREAARAEDLSNLSDEELLELAAKVLDTTKPKLTKEE